MKLKKTSKIILGVIVFLTLPSLVLFGFLYFKYNEPLPNGITGDEADKLASSMLAALNYSAYEKTDYIEWTFKKKRHFKWKKSENVCEVYWKDYKVTLDFSNHSNNKASVHSFTVEGELGTELIDKALKYFYRDSFWLVAPYHVFNENIMRKTVTLNDNSKALLITYPLDHFFKGDSVLWLLDDYGKPRSFKMWTSKLPIKGLEVSWNNWTEIESGALLPTFHKLLFLGFENTDIKTGN